MRKSDSLHSNGSNLNASIADLGIDESNLSDYLLLREPIIDDVYIDRKNIYNKVVVIIIERYHLVILLL